MNFTLTFIRNLFLGLVIGLFASVYLFQYTQQYKALIETQVIDKLEKLYECKFNCEIKKIGIISPGIDLKAIVVNTKSGSWYWKAKKIKVRSSWINYLINKTFNLAIEIDDLQIYSKIENGDLAIQSHIEQLLKSSNLSLPTSITNITLNKSNIELCDVNNEISLNLSWNSKSKKLIEQFKSNIYLQDGKLSIKEFDFVNQLLGSLQIDSVNINNETKLSLSTKINFDLLGIKCFLSGKLNENIGTFKGGTIHGNALISPINLSFDKDKLQLEVHGQLPIEFFNQVNSKIPKLNGMCATNLNILYSSKEKSIHGHCTLTNIGSEFPKAWNIDEAKIYFEKKNNLWKGTIVIEKINQLEILGSWQFDENSGLGKISLTNNRQIELANGWILEDKGFAASLEITKDLNIKCNVSGSAKNKKLEQLFKINLSLNGKPDNIVGSGNIDKIEINLAGQIYPNFIIDKLSFKEHSEDHDCLIIKKDEDFIDALIDFHYIKKLLPNNISNFVSGNGYLRFIGKYQDNLLKGKIKLSNGSILIPKIYNTINDLQTDLEVNISEKKLTIKLSLLPF